MAGITNGKRNSVGVRVLKRRRYQRHSYKQFQWWGGGNGGEKKPM